MNILITGASQGIGKALAFVYADKNNKLLLLARNTDSLKQICEQIKNNCSDCFYMKCDVTDYDNVKESVNYAKEKLGKVDLAILNSGIGEPEWMDNFTSASFKRVYSVNVFGLAHFFEFLIPLMRAQGYGTIAGVSSMADVRGYSGSASYCSSKAAATVFLEAARVQLKQFNIHVITIRPGFVKTAMTDKNEFHMPFLMDVQRAAKIIKRGILKRKSVIQFPFPIVMSTRILKILPNWLFDWGVRKARPQRRKK